MDIARIWIMDHDENLSVFFCHAMKIVRNVSTADKEHNNFFIVLQISISDWRLCVDWQMFVSFFCAKNFQGFLNWQIFKWYLSGKASGQIMFELKIILVTLIEVGDFADSCKLRKYNKNSSILSYDIYFCPDSNYLFFWKIPNFNQSYLNNFQFKHIFAARLAT